MMWWGFRNAPRHHHPTEWLWRECQSIKSQFCEAVVAAGYLTWEQMVSAACRYRLGASKLGGVIFWQIDQDERVRDGKVMYYGPDCHRLKDKEHHPTWVSTLLRLRDPFPNAPHETSHCFFGTHLLTESHFKGHTDLRSALPLATKGTQDCHTDLFPHSCQAQPVPKALSVKSVQSVCHKKSVCVVEAEKTAVILSELYPQYVWLAAGGLGEVQADKFRPLRGHKVVLFPDTDPDGTAFKRWSDAATTVMQQPFWEDSPPIRVSPLLELHASSEQKSRKIDLIDFVFDDIESCSQPPYSFTPLLLRKMKSMSKQQLADKAGVSLNTLNKWCKPIQKDLLQLGMIPGARMLPPVVVKYIAERFCIDL